MAILHGQLTFTPLIQNVLSRSNEPWLCQFTPLIGFQLEMSLIVAKRRFTPVSYALSGFPPAPYQ
jgi:hypothetical protein